MKAKIKAWLKGRSDCWFFMPATHGYGTSGVPDIVGCYRGVFFAVEVKAPGKLSTLTVLQKQAIAHINGAQGWACVADNLNTVIEMILLIDIALEAQAA